MRNKRIYRFTLDEDRMHPVSEDFVLEDILERLFAIDERLDDMWPMIKHIYNYVKYEESLEPNRFNISDVDIDF